MGLTSSHILFLSLSHSFSLIIPFTIVGASAIWLKQWQFVIGFSNALDIQNTNERRERINEWMDW